MTIAKKRMVAAGGSLVSIPSYSGDWTGCDGEDDIERQLVKKPTAKEGRGGNWLSWQIPTSALLAVVVMVGLYQLSASWVVFLAFILAAAVVAVVALCRHKLRRTWVLVTRNLRRKPCTKNDRRVRWFIGEEVDDNLEGKWVKRYEDGRCYEGEFARGKSHGLGVARYQNGEQYEGEWKEGLHNGYGIEIYPMGSRYEGMFKDGAMSGLGMMTSSTGELYAGQWLAGRANGLGYYQNPYGECYYGEFKNGEKHGLGRFNFGTGDEYAGEFFGNKFYGYGVYQSTVDGRCYEGSWHEGRVQGVRMLTSRDEDVSCGDWDCNYLQNPHPPSSACVLKAVESARLAAEKASLLPVASKDVESAVEFSRAKAAAARGAADKAVRYHTRVCALKRAFGWHPKTQMFGRNTVSQSLQKLKDAMFDGWTKWD